MMLEIKDKEASAVRAVQILRELAMLPPAPAGYVLPDPAPRPAPTPPKKPAAAKKTAAKRGPAEA